MDDGPREIKVIRDHFQLPTSGVESLENRTPSLIKPGTAKSLRYCILVEKGKETGDQKVIRSV